MLYNLVMAFVVGIDVDKVDKVSRVFVVRANVREGVGLGIAIGEYWPGSHDHSKIEDRDDMARGGTEGLVVFLTQNRRRGDSRV